MEIFSHSKTTNREGQVVATGGYDLQFGFDTGHSGNFFLIFCSHTRQIQIFTEISQLTIDYRFFIFFIHCCSHLSTLMMSVIRHS